jgi:hypothetical protein
MDLLPPAGRRPHWSNASNDAGAKVTFCDREGGRQTPAARKTPTSGAAVGAKRLIGSEMFCARRINTSGPSIGPIARLPLRRDTDCPSGGSLLGVAARSQQNSPSAPASRASLRSRPWITAVPATDFGELSARKGSRSETARADRGKEPLEILSTHPVDSDRIKTIRQELPEALKYYRPRAASV